MALATVVMIGCGGQSPSTMNGDGAVPADAVVSEGDSGSPPDEAYRSGSRIKVRYLTTSDGAKIFQGLYDAVRQENCNFAVAPDGALRCLPESVAFATANAYYADASCTTPAAVSICEAVYMVAYTNATSCPFSNRYTALYRTTPVASLYLKSGASCVASAPPAGYHAYGPAGLELSPSAFQSATQVIE